jgi:predicted ATPase/class 3 adenylate cyclase
MTVETQGAADSTFKTFLITDIEGSTRLWEQHGSVMGAALEVHDRLLRNAIDGAGGSLVKTTGDGMLAVFDDPVAAVTTALAGQRALRDSPWGATGPLRVRMALHSGTAESREGDFFGPALNRDARILAIGHGGQVLTSAATAILARDRLPGSVELRDLGSHRLRDLDRPEQVFQVVVADLQQDFPALRSLSTRRSNLPVQLTSFVGRERELGEVEALIGRHRLVTLIGTGGTGKTRLMLEAAGRIAHRFEEGAWLAELAPLGDPSQVPSEIARGLGAPEIPGQPTIDAITAFLAEKELLLLLDNAEHLVDGVAHIADRLLAAAPRLRILTTSREALAVPGEAVLQLQSLSCPPPSSRGAISGPGIDIDAVAATEAVRLFTERASAVDPTFVLDGANVGAVAEICRRLDGIPLAIELAAARVSALSPEDIEKRLGDRFRLLAGGRRTAVPRQQTLHALIDWSWDLLTEEDRRMLRRLSIFAGGWTTDAAARIVGDGDAPMDTVELVDGLTRLVDRSLVVVDRGPSTRYHMLETIRQYAREKLIAAGEVGSLADRHFAAYAALVLAAEPELGGPGMVDWVDRLDADAENLSAALEWGLEADPWSAVRMALGLLAYWAVRVASSDNDARIIAAVEIARARTVGVAGIGADDQALAARLLAGAARMWAMSGRAEVALPWAADSGALARASGSESALAYAVSADAITAAFTGGGAKVAELFLRGAELAERSGEALLVAFVAGFAGATISVADPATGEALVALGREAARRVGNPYAIAATAVAEGRLHGNLGRTDAAVAAFEIAVTRFTELGDELFTLAARSDMAHALRRGGRLDEAEQTYRQTIRDWVHLGQRGAVANQLENFAYLAAERGSFERAARLLGAAEAIREAARTQMSWDEEPEYRRFVDLVRSRSTPNSFDHAWEAGRALGMSAAVAEAISPP